MIHDRLNRYNNNNNNNNNNNRKNFGKQMLLETKVRLHVTRKVIFKCGVMGGVFKKRDAETVKAAKMSFL
jgi:hypothetical protein